MSVPRYDFAGKVVVVTGGGSGIGLAISTMFAQAGARVVIGGRKLDRLTAAAATIGDNCRAIQTDVRDPESCQQLIQQSVDAFGGLDIVINNAGRGWLTPLRAMEAEVWQNDFALNAHGPFYCSHAAFPFFKEQGSGVIVNISSLAGLHGSMGTGAYSAAKAALQMFTRVAAAEWGPHGIRVNCVAPGMIATELALAGWAKTGFDAAEASKGFPLRRPGRPDEVAQAVLFFASDASSYVSGETLAVGGGPQLRGMIDV
jgi:3-oxoacyl-[acyl-carrier protein] reductase